MNYNITLKRTDNIMHVPSARLLNRNQLILHPIPGTFIVSS